jgi:hypothetical protein
MFNLFSGNPASKKCNRTHRSASIQKRVVVGQTKKFASDARLSECVVRCRKNAQFLLLLLRVRDEEDVRFISAFLKILLLSFKPCAAKR